MLTVINSKEGRILVSDKDKYIGRSFIEYGEFSRGEVELFEFAICKQDVVADIGANFGAHTLVFSRLAKTVYAVEPQRMVYNALCGTLALNDITNVIAVNCAIGETSGAIGCVNIDPNVENNFGGMGLRELPTESIEYTIPLLPFTSHVNFMKVDVEGMEVEVIKGSAEMIKACRPTIYIENDRKDHSEELIKLLQSLGYHCHWHLTSLFSGDNYFDNKVDVFPGITSLNMLCIQQDIIIPGMQKVTAPLFPNYEYTQ